MTASFRFAIVAVVIIAVGSVVPVETQGQAHDDSIGLLDDCIVLLTMKVSDADNAMKVGPAMQCLWFVDGLIAMNALYQGLVLEPDKTNGQHETGFFCMPHDGIQTIDAVVVVVKHITAMPINEARTTTRRLAVTLALAKAYPCKGNQNSK